MSATNSREQNDGRTLIRSGPMNGGRSARLPKEENGNEVKVGSVCGKHIENNEWPLLGTAAKSRRSIQHVPDYGMSYRGRHDRLAVALRVLVLWKSLYY